MQKGSQFSHIYSPASKLQPPMSPRQRLGGPPRQRVEWRWPAVCVCALWWVCVGEERSWGARANDVNAGPDEAMIRSWMHGQQGCSFLSIEITGIQYIVEIYVRGTHKAQHMQTKPDETVTKVQVLQVENKSSENFPKAKPSRVSVQAHCDGPNPAEIHHSQQQRGRSSAKAAPQHPSLFL